MLKKSSMLLAAGAMALALAAPQAEAKDRGAAIAAGVIFGVVAGAIIADAANRAHATPYVYHEPAYEPVYVAPRRYHSYAPQPVYTAEPYYDYADDVVVVKKHKKRKVRRVIIEEYID